MEHEQETGRPSRLNRLKSEQVGPNNSGRFTGVIEII